MSEHYLVMVEGELGHELPRYPVGCICTNQECKFAAHPSIWADANEVLATDRATIARLSVQLKEIQELPFSEYTTVYTTDEVTK
jgi:hypothetical protein